MNTVQLRQLRKPIIVVLIIQLFLVVWLWGIRQVFSTAAPSGSLTDLYKGVAVEPNPWLEPWQRWDTLHYQAIAERGYAAFDTALFTPPLYPLLMRWSSFLTGNTLLAGLLISSICTLLAAIMLYRLAAYEFADQADAFRTTLYLVSFPAAVFLFAAYSEALFLFAVIACLYAARSRKWIAAGLWGAIAAVTRTPGPFLAIPLLYAAWQAWKEGDRQGWVAVVLTGIGAMIYPGYVWIGLKKFPTAILDALNQRGGYLTFPGLNLVEAARRVFIGQLPEENAMELFFALLFVVLTFYVWKKLPRLYGVYAVMFMLLFLARMGSPQPLVSMARYVMEIFPAFMILGVWGRNPWVNRLILYPSWIALLFFAGQFAIWGWVG